MKFKIRRSCQDDLNNIHQLHTECFMPSDHWYHSAIKHYLDNSIVIERLNNTNTTNTKQIIGVLLQGTMIPCNKKFSSDEIDETFNITTTNNTTTNNTTTNNTDYKEDIFEPVNETGILFTQNNTQYTNVYGIVMICIHPEYRKKGLAKKLITKHFEDSSKTNKYVCLNTRLSNINAYNLYKSMEYEHIAFIKNKYFLPNEDSIFMIKYLT